MPFTFGVIMADAPNIIQRKTDTVLISNSTARELLVEETLPIGSVQGNRGVHLRISGRRKVDSTHGIGTELITTFDITLGGTVLWQGDLQQMSDGSDNTSLWELDVVIYAKNADDDQGMSGFLFLGPPSASAPTVGEGPTGIAPFLQMMRGASAVDMTLQQTLEVGVTMDAANPDDQWELLFLQLDQV